MKGFFILHVLMFILNHGQTSSKTVDTRTTRNLSTQGGGDPLMWLLVQQITSFGSRLDKVAEKVNTFEKAIEEKNDVVISNVQSKVDEMSVKVEKNDRKTKKLVDKNKAFVSDKIGTVEASVKNISGRLNSAISNVQSKIDEMNNKVENNDKKTKKLLDEKLSVVNKFVKDGIDKVQARIENNAKSVNKVIDNKIKAVQGQLAFIKSKATQKRQGCQDGTIGKARFPVSPFPLTFNVRFSPAFESAPAVVTGMIHYDNDKNTNDRLNIAVSGVTRQGFNVRISTFADTRLYGVYVRWMACSKSV